MAIKRKEKQLTREEMVAKFISERKELWHYSEPLFVPNATKDGPRLFSLTKDNSNRILIVFSGDSVSITYEMFLQLIKTLNKSYANLGWHPVAVMPLNHPFLESESVRDKYFNIRGQSTPAIWLDSTLEFEKIFPHPDQAKASVHCFIEETLVESIPMNQEVENILFKIEKLFQTELRKNDPGLPLPTLSKKTELFQTIHEVFHDMKAGLQGHWFPQRGFVTSDDPKSSLSIPIHGKGLKIILDLENGADESQRVYVTLDDEPFPYRLHGDLFRSNIKGESFFEIRPKMQPTVVYSSEEIITGTLRFEFREALESKVRYSGAFERK